MLISDDYQKKNDASMSHTAKKHLRDLSHGGPIILSTPIEYFVNSYFSVVVV